MLIQNDLAQKLNRVEYGRTYYLYGLTQVSKTWTTAEKQI